MNTVSGTYMQMGAAVQADERGECKSAFLQSYVKPTTELICPPSLLFPKQRISYPQSQA